MTIVDQIYSSFVTSNDFVSGYTIYYLNRTWSTSCNQQGSPGTAGGLSTCNTGSPTAASSSAISSPTSIIYEHVTDITVNPPTIADYSGTAPPPSSQISTAASQLPSIWRINGGIIAGFLAFNIVALMDAKLLRRNDYFQANAIMKAMFGVLDVVSDVIFSISLTVKHYDQSDVHSVPFGIVVICWTTIVLPILLSVAQLWRQSRSSWLREDVVSSWMLRYPFILFVLPFFCGSAFVAVAIMNSNAFQLGLFSMGLSRDELGKFNLKRVWSIIVLEVCIAPMFCYNFMGLYQNVFCVLCSQNIPQLALSLWFLIDISFSEVAFASAVFSLISIFGTILANCTQRDILVNRQRVLVQFTVRGLTLDQEYLQTQTRGIVKSIANLLGLHRDLIYIEQPRGFRFKIELYINYVQYKDVDYKALMNNAFTDGTLEEIFRSQWNLQTALELKDLKYEEIQSENQTKNTVHILARNNDEVQAIQPRRQDSLTDDMALDMELAAMPEVGPTPSGLTTTFSEGAHEAVRKQTSTYAEREGADTTKLE